MVVAISVEAPVVAAVATFCDVVVVSTSAVDDEPDVDVVSSVVTASTVAVDATPVEVPVVGRISGDVVAANVVVTSVPVAVEIEIVALVGNAVAPFSKVETCVFDEVDSAVEPLVVEEAILVAVSTLVEAEEVVTSLLLVAEMDALVLTPPAPASVVDGSCLLVSKR